MLGPGSGPGSAGRPQRSHSPSLCLGGPVCGTAAAMPVLPPHCLCPGSQGRGRETLLMEDRAACVGDARAQAPEPRPGAPPPPPPDLPGPASGPVACQVARTHSRTHPVAPRPGQEVPRVSAQPQPGILLAGQCLEAVPPALGPGGWGAGCGVCEGPLGLWAPHTSLPSRLGSLTRWVLAGSVRKDSSPRSRGTPFIPPSARTARWTARWRVSRGGCSGRQGAGRLRPLGGRVPRASAGEPLLSHQRHSEGTPGRAGPGGQDACCRGPHPHPQAPEKRAEVTDRRWGRAVWHGCWESGRAAVQ